MGSRRRRRNVAAVAFRKESQRLTKPIEEIDREELTEFCDCAVHAAWISIAAADTGVGPAARCGRCASCPARGAPALEVTVSDGRGAVVGVFLGRRKIAGLSPGRRVAFEGVAARDGKRYLVFNPVYELLQPERGGPSARPSRRQAPVRIRRTSSSDSGVTIASTSSPASKIESPRGITTCSARTIATMVALRGTSRSRDRRGRWPASRRRG